MRAYDFYIVTSGIFEGHEGYLTNVAGINMLKNPDPKEGDWSYIMALDSEIEFLCSIMREPWEIA